MLFKFVVILVLAVGTTGIVIALNKLSGGRFPKWVLPAAIATTIIGYNVFDEYSWYGRKTAALGGNWVIINEHSPRVFWRPWTLIKQPVSAFLAINTENNINIDGAHNVFQTILFTTSYLGTASGIPFALDCNNAMFGPYFGDLTDVAWDAIPPAKEAELCPSQ